MRHVPEDIQSFYRTQLHLKVPTELHYSYVKWLRFYLDFCAKYRFTEYENTTFQHFADKLAQKRVTPSEIEDAYQAVQLLFPFYSEPIQNDTLQNKEDVIRSLVAVIRGKNYSPRTLEAYCKWNRDFLRYYKGTVEEITDATAREYLNHLVMHKNVSSSAHHQAFNALLFLYRHVLKRDFGQHNGNLRPKRHGKKVPIVLSRNELNALLDNVTPQYSLHFKLMYGCGLRVSELLNLRIKDIDFENELIAIQSSKGSKSRSVPLPLKLKDELSNAIVTVLELAVEYDIKTKYKGVFLPKSISPNKGKERGWLWLFPATKLVEVTSENALYWYHLHHTVLGKELKKALKKTEILKQVTPHTLRHTYATHLLQNGYDIRTIQELLGHASIETTMVYLHVMKDISPKAPISPLDIVWN